MIILLVNLINDNNFNNNNFDFLILNNFPYCSLNINPLLLTTLQFVLFPKCEPPPAGC